MYRCGLGEDAEHGALGLIYKSMLRRYFLRPLPLFLQPPNIYISAGLYCIDTQKVPLFHRFFYRRNSYESEVRLFQGGGGDETEL